MSDGRVGEIAVVRAESGVGNGPLAEGVVDGFVVFPFIGVGGVIHADLEVLGAREKEVAIIGVLATVCAGVVVDDLVSHGSCRDQVLSNEPTLAAHGGTRIEAETAPHQTFVEVGATSSAGVDVGVT